MNKTALALALTLFSASASYAYSPCRVPAPAKPGVRVSCSPEDAANWPTVQASFVLSNLACDNATGTLKPDISVGSIGGGGFNEVANEEDISKLPVAVGGKPEARLIEKVGYARGGNTDRIDMEIGPRADGTDNSRIEISTVIDRTSSFRRTRMGLNDVSHWATVSVTRILPSGEREEHLERGYACSYINEGVRSVAFNVGSWTIDFE